MNKTGRVAGRWMAMMMLLGGLLAAPMARAGELVVFSSQGGDFSPGDTLDGSMPLRLEAGQRLTLIADNGRILRLSGPYHQAPQPPGKDKNRQGLSKALKSLVVPFHVTMGGLGGTRDTEFLQGLLARGWVPDPWLIDVTRAGDHCLREGSPAVFWRPSPDSETAILLRDRQREWVARTRWPRGMDKLASPGTMTYRDGGGYEVIMNGQRTALTLHIIPQTVKSKGALAAWMNEKACSAQTVALLQDGR